MTQFVAILPRSGDEDRDGTSSPPAVPVNHSDLLEQCRKAFIKRYFPERMNDDDWEDAREDYGD